MSGILKCLMQWTRTNNYYKYIILRCISLSASKQNIQDNILRNPYQVNIPKVSASEFIFSKTEPYSDYIAFECAVTHRKYTFRDIQKYSKNLSKVLRKKFGLNKGDVVLIYMPNCPEFPIAALGCLEAGLIASTANWLYTSEEILRQVKDSSAKLVITTCDLYNNAAKAVAQLPDGKLPIICVKAKAGQSFPQGSINFAELINTILDVPDLDPPSPNDIALLPYSSGTTGLPKGVILSHANIISNIVQLSAPNINFIENASGRYQEISPGVLPMFHVYGFAIRTLYLMTKGAKLLTLPKFSPKSYTDVMKNNPVSLIFGAPPLILFLTHHSDVKKDYFKSLKSVVSAAAPLAALDEDKFIEKAGSHVSIFQGYGLTETLLITIAQNQQRVKGSIGKVLPNTQVKLVKTDDSAAVALGPKEQGELLVRGPQVMQGYLNNQEATQKTFQGEWFKTGDLGYFNEEGYLFITDRVKELIKVKGFQVAPAELEAVLRHHPKVKDAAVIGIPHEINGEVPRAYVVTKEGVSPDDISQFVAGKVAKFKQLKGGIEFVEEIPKSSAGKILRRQLKQKFLAEGQI